MLQSLARHCYGWEFRVVAVAVISKLIIRAIPRREACVISGMTIDGDPHTISLGIRRSLFWDICLQPPVEIRAVQPHQHWISQFYRAYFEAMQEGARYPDGSEFQKWCKQRLWLAGVS